MTSHGPGHYGDPQPLANSTPGLRLSLGSEKACPSQKHGAGTPGCHKSSGCRAMISSADRLEATQTSAGAPPTSMCTSHQLPGHRTRAWTCPTGPRPRSCRRKQRAPGPTSECSKMGGQKPIPSPTGQALHPGPHTLGHRNTVLLPCVHVYNTHTRPP